jgi:hypothetical protein
MLEKRDWVAGTVIAYVFLVFLYFLLQERLLIDEPCSFDKPCVRFCCIDQSACKDKYIRESFNGSLLSRYRDENETIDYFILHGKPRCNMKMILKNDTNNYWSFSSVSESDQWIRERSWVDDGWLTNSNIRMSESQQVWQRFQRNLNESDFELIKRADSNNFVLWL